MNDKFSVLKDYRSELTFEWIPEPGALNDEVIEERKKRWFEVLEQDFYIDEAVNILEDLNINLRSSVAQVKK
jgi:carboxyl-terminal processing protease